MDLNNWKKDWGLMPSFFKPEDINEIKNRLEKLIVKNVVFCSFENRFAKSGGLAAVILNLLPYLKETNKIPKVILMTPFYTKIADKAGLRPTGKYFNLPFGKRSVKVEIYEYKWDYTKPEKGNLREYYLKAEGFFGAENKLNDPYIYNEKDYRLNDDALRDNSLFFCKAVPPALKAVGIQENLILHLHEWQTALISLTSKEAMINGTLKSCGTVQTMHNPYDSFIPAKALEKIIDRPLSDKGSIGYGLTAYQTGLQLTDAPVTTVSENFAGEFTSDILQTKHFAPHLQEIFRRGVYGVNNGMFVDFSSEFPGRERHTPDEIKAIKLKNRKTLLKILNEYNPEERIGELTYRGGPVTALPDDIPILVMSGRLDPNQKGYDILLQAIEKFAADEIKVVLTPLPVRRSDLDYFYEVACKCRGNVSVFPIRMEMGFKELQTGGTYGIMPSIYEPFGAAVEYMANGTVNIARQTGGLTDQIGNGKCGLLYREDMTFYDMDNIKAFIEAGDIVQVRRKNRWVQGMADELYKTLKYAVELYRNRQGEYYKLILNGFKRAGNFGWGTTAEKYFEVYKKVKEGF